MTDTAKEAVQICGAVKLLYFAINPSFLKMCFVILTTSIKHYPNRHMYSICTWISVDILWFFFYNCWLIRSVTETSINLHSIFSTQ